MIMMPVANGILPRPNGGRITGMFIKEYGGNLLCEVGVGKDVFVCPWIVDEQGLYPIGVICRILNITNQIAVDEDNNEIPVVMAVLEGQGHARWNSINTVGSYLISDDIEYINFKTNRSEYPVISGAGWIPTGGFTEFRGKTDIPVIIYGNDLMSNRQVTITANLGGLVSEEKAHTIEHSVIRALRTYGICSAKTLIESMEKESTELKQSLEYSIRWSMPELLGVTGSGVCGNPMTNLAKFYLTKDLIQNIRLGKSYADSMQAARNRTMSKLTEDLNITMDSGLRVMQGLKKGMRHDDSPLKIELCKKVIIKFPFDPW